MVAWLAVSDSLLMVVGVIHIGVHERQTPGPAFECACDAAPIAKSGKVRIILNVS
tara:strand:+ start:707 stop:871 length:165 start_codon:yes stop_codon:yes gene_type:complete